MSADPGRFQHRITIRQPGTRTQTATGWTTSDPVVVASGVWAEVEPIDGYEKIQAMQTEAGATHRVRMWYREGITAAMEVLHRSRVLQIIQPPINVGEDDEVLELMCKEVI